MIILRDYQQEAVDKIIQRHKIILGDERGLGKTIVTLKAIHHLVPGNGQVLILATRSALGVWQDHIRDELDVDAHIYSGEVSPTKRQRLWEDFKEQQPYALIATYAMAKEICAYRASWQALVCDEYHRVGLMNHKSATYKNVARIRNRFMVLVTGTPIRKSPADLFAPFHLLDSYRFGSYWQFIGAYCIRTENFFGFTIEPRPKNPKAFAEMIKPYLIFRTKKKVLKDLPAKTRAVIKLAMTPKQAKLYTGMAERLEMCVDGQIIAAPNKAASIVRLRQLLVTPQIFGSTEEGAAIPALLEGVEGEFDNNRSVVVCTPFKSGLKVLAEALRKLTPHIFIIHGDIKGSVQDIAKEFQALNTTRKVLLYTVGSGTAFDAYSASTAFFVGYEWSANDNLQAEDRIHRMGQTDAVFIYYFLHENTIDTSIMDKLDEKTMASNWVLHTEQVLELMASQSAKKSMQRSP